MRQKKKGGNPQANDDNCAAFAAAISGHWGMVSVCGKYGNSPMLAGGLCKGAGMCSEH